MMKRPSKRAPLEDEFSIIVSDPESSHKSEHELKGGIPKMKKLSANKKKKLCTEEDKISTDYSSINPQFDHSDLDTFETKKRENLKCLLSSRMKKSSQAWEYYEKHPTKDGRLRCKLCSKEAEYETSYAVGSSTTTLLRHYYNMHEKKNNIKICEPFRKKGTSKEELTEKRKDSLNMLIINEDLPFSFVQSPNFRSFCKILAPQYKVPCEAIISNNSENLLLENKMKLKCLLKSVESKISITIYEWKSMNYESFIGITGHFIDNSWELRAVVLDMFHFPKPHTAENIATRVTETLNDWEISHKIFCVTSDRGPNYVKARKYLTGNTSNECFENEKNLFHFHHFCGTHVIQSIVSAFTKVSRDAKTTDPYSELVRKLRNIIELIGQSPSIMKSLDEKCKKLGVDSKMPALNLPKKWNSTLDMLRSVQNLFPVLVEVTKCEKSLANYYLINEEKEEVDSIIVFLEKIEKITLLLSPEKKGSIIELSILYNGLLVLLTNYETNVTLGYLATAAKKEFLKILMDSGLQLLKTASILDPRLLYKINLVTDGNIFEERKKIEIMASEYFKALYSNQKALKPKLPPFSTNIGNLCYMVEVFLDETFNYNGQTDEIDEFDEYLKACFSLSDSFSKNMDIIQWWKLYSGNFPQTALMARDFLAVPPSITVAERLLLSTGKFNDHSSYNSKFKALRARVCLENWQKLV